ncbi:MAG: fibronectin/fibrinogen-binding protein [Clostridiales bacterium]|jgi:predicted ribosome quality control (RQC) complex YloA/Tae2 family protein|nr:fibronectin/fibrinogen-binding protein [Clostridiales bacterium]
MPLDAVFVSALRAELNELLPGMRIDKIQQPEKDVFIFQVRGRGVTKKLLIAAGVGSARVHFTDITRENPQSPPMFCMLLRKHLIGARIVSVRQPYLERILDIEMDTFDEMGVNAKKRIILEMIGKHSNFILLDSEGRVIDCLRKVDAEMSEVRQVLPGLFYRLPPGQNKHDPFTVTVEELEKYAEAQQDKTVDSFLLNTFSGLSPLMCREISYRCTGNTDIRLVTTNKEELFACFLRFMELLKTGPYTPFMLFNQDIPFDFSCIPILQYGSLMSPSSLNSCSELLDSFFTEKEKRERTRQRSQHLLKTIKNLRDRTVRKLQAQNEELKATYVREKMREQGDIIKANIHRMYKGMSLLKAQNFYAQDAGEIEIPLDEKLTPQQNAAKYYKAYAKAKNAEIMLKEQISSASDEQMYLESVLEEISRAQGEKDLNEIRHELIIGGYLKNKDKNDTKKAKSPEPAPLRFKSSSGITIYVGKNNLQNDKLTLKTALKNETWLHTQKIHGSHVIIKAPFEETDTQTIKEAAMLAAFYSRAQHGENVPVDYTRVKNVKKPHGAKPGMVIYTDYQTVFVTPDARHIDKMHNA